MKQIDVAIIGAGAAGLMCALEARKRGRSVMLLDHAAKIGEKIRISGGGRCNFTNLDTRPERYLSQNPHFCKSALKRFTAHDFLALVEQHDIAWYEKEKGALFCKESADQIIDLLITELDERRLQPSMGVEIREIEREDGRFVIETSDGRFSCTSLVIATGGKSIPKIGATGFGFQIAEQFGLELVEPRPALVPLTFDENFRSELKDMSGNSVDVTVRCNKKTFTDAMLFTHRGLSGPAILQISSFWREGDALVIDLCPGKDLAALLRKAREETPKLAIHTVLAMYLPKKIAGVLCQKANISGAIADLSNKRLDALVALVCNWQVKPTGSEGYRTAEVTLGGVDTAELSSKTMEARNIPGLYFIGEVVDVTGWLGGYNFQWAWSSGWCAGQYV